MSEILNSPGVLALELSAGAAPISHTLSRDQADELARHLADDLVRLLPSSPGRAGADHADLLVLGALYDPAQVLQPGWPLYAQLAELAEHGRLRDAAGAARVVAFGSHAGAMPLASLQPTPERIPGALLLLPWSFSAGAELAADLGARMESVFMAKGEAGAHTADFLMRALDLRLQHARYMTRHDLCALLCAQMEHAGFSALWQMLEFGLLYPQRDGDATTSRGRRLRFHAGQVQCALPDYADWLAQCGRAADVTEREQHYAGWLFELRQYAALLAAHRLPLQFDGNAGSATLPLQLLADADPALPPPQLYAHEARGLGIVVVSVAQLPAAGRPRLLAHAWPLEPAGLDAAVAGLARRFGAAPVLHRLGRVQLDADAAALTVAAPATPLH